MVLTRPGGPKPEPARSTRVRAGWDVVAPNGAADLALGWVAIHCRGRPPMPVPILKADPQDAVMKIATNYFEDGG
jgi:hypothetical protein